MAESSDPLLLTKRAEKLSKPGAASGVPGVLMITRAKVRWQPNDPSSGEATAVLEVDKITSELRFSSHWALHVAYLHFSWPAFPRPACLPACLPACPPARNPAGKQQIAGKPLLRLVTPQLALGLCFESEEDKGEVLNLLAQLKPPQPQQPKQPQGTGAGVGIGVPSEARRKELFARDGDLEILYGQLVIAGILSEQVFLCRGCVCCGGQDASHMKDARRPLHH